ncbi:MAG: hypothetical protein OEW08_11385 [Gammaproteobacteria bacterium]|nr:hypothetical protein [Gammaproteobacteria bacterium]
MKRWIHRVLFAFTLLIAMTRTVNAWEEVAWRTSAIAATTMDWLQTRDIARQCLDNRVYEKNPILGRCPTRDRVDAYFVAVALGWTGVWYVLPRDWRNPLHISIFFIESKMVLGNAAIGVRMEI